MPLRGRVPWLAAGALGAAVAAAAALRRRRRSTPPPPPVLEDRASELRRRLDESRALVGEREAFESGETPLDRAPTVEDTVEERRRLVHEQGRAAIDELGGGRQQPDR